MMVAILIIPLLAVGYWYWRNYRQYATVRRFSPSDDLLNWVRSQRSVEAIQRWCVDNLRYASDQELWGRADYWATPQETWEQRAGDCECQHLFLAWAIAMHTGRPAHLLIVNKDRIHSHGVTAFQRDGGWVVLNYWQWLEGDELEPLLPLITDSCPVPKPYSYVSQQWELPTGRRV